MEEIIVRLKANMTEETIMDDISWAYIPGCKDVEVIKVAKPVRSLKELANVIDNLFIEVFDVFGFTQSEIESSSRQRDKVYIRFVIAAILKWEYRLPLKDIGSILGGRDHTTVIHCLTTCKNLIQTKDEGFMAHTYFIEKNVNRDINIMFEGMERKVKLQKRLKEMNRLNKLNK